MVVRVTVAMGIVVGMSQNIGGAGGNAIIVIGSVRSTVNNIIAGNICGTGTPEWRHLKTASLRQA